MNSRQHCIQMNIFAFSLFGCMCECVYQKPMRKKRVKHKNTHTQHAIESFSVSHYVLNNKFSCRFFDFFAVVVVVCFLFHWWIILHFSFLHTFFVASVRLLTHRAISILGALATKPFTKQRNEC